jgi:hypothetical protein
LTTGFNIYFNFLPGILARRNQREFPAAIGGDRVAAGDRGELLNYVVGGTRTSKVTDGTSKQAHNERFNDHTMSAPSAFI